MVYLLIEFALSVNLELMAVNFHFLNYRQKDIELYFTEKTCNENGKIKAMKFIIQFLLIKFL
jgi:hypothetical protein